MDTISRDQLASITGGGLIRQIFRLDRQLSRAVQQQTTGGNELTTICMAAMLGRALQR